MQEPHDDALIETIPVCIHHWKLASPVGGISQGLCSECGASRDFGQLFPSTSAYGRPRRK